MVYSAGDDGKGLPTLRETVCPSRLLRDAPDAVEFVSWWLMAVNWQMDPRTGRMLALSVREWPFRGGMLKQPQPIIEAAELLLGEWPSVRIPKPEQGGAS